MQGKECKLHYEIIESSSRGNCVVVEDMMFDCGLPYSKIRKYLYKIKYLFLTHVHSDHINSKTLMRLKKDFPRIEVIGNHDVYEIFGVDTIVGDQTVLMMKDRTVHSFPCPHDVICHGFAIEMENINLIYATDTTTLKHAPELKYDYLFIESNHDENKINAIRDNSRQKYGYDAWQGAMRHLSTQQSKAFYYINRRGPDSEWIELHKSNRFY